jgi:uncharacterized protein
MSIEVRNNPAESRYEAWLDDELAGIAVYELGPSTVIFVHTEVLPAFEGKGIGGALAKGALDDVRAGGESDVLPLCPFIKGYIEKHQPEYDDLVHHRD